MLPTPNTAEFTTELGDFGPHLRAHNFMTRKRQYCRQASEIIKKLTFKREATPESLEEEFNDIVVQLDILKEKYFPNERKDYPQFIAINILDFPLFMYNHWHWGRYNIIKEDRKLADSLFKSKTDAAWKSFIEFLSLQGVTLPDKNISEGIKKKSVQIADKAQSIPWKTPWSDFECKDLSYNKKMQLEEFYTSVTNSYNELVTPNQLSKVDIYTCGEPPCTIIPPNLSNLLSPHCQYHCFKGQATSINNLITQKVGSNIQRQSEDRKESIYLAITLALAFNGLCNLHLFGTPFLNAILNGEQLKLPESHSIVVKTFQKSMWSSMPGLVLYGSLIRFVFSKSVSFLL